MRKIGILIAVFIALLPFAAADFVIINSENWMDVYSGGLYATLKGSDFRFLVTEQSMSTIQPFLRKDNPIFVIESEKAPFSINLADSLRVQGYQTQGMFTSGTASNLDLAKRLNVQNYIVVDPSYGHDAISVLSYATLTNRYVLFTDKNNIAQIIQFLNSRPHEQIMIYGIADAEVLQKLAIYNPEIINKGNKFENNLEIVKKYRQAQPTKQVIVTTGEVLERELFYSGREKEPIVLVGRDNVPEETLTYLQNSGIEVSVIIGSNLAFASRQLKELAGLQVFLKFGQATTQEAGFQEVGGLDIFRLPTAQLEIAIAAVTYNTVTKSLEVILDNKADLKTFTKSTITVLADEAREATIGDTRVERIDRQERKGFRYAVDLTEKISEGANLTAELFVQYGEAPTTLESAVTSKQPIEIITAEDNCELELRSAAFNEKIQRFLIEVKNSGAVACYADASIIDLIVDDEKTTISLSGFETLAPKETKELAIRQRMTDIDLIDNEEVTVRVQYGERQDLLFKSIEETIELDMVSGNTLGEWISENKSLLIVIIVALVIIYYLHTRRPPRKKKSDTENE